MPGVNDLFAAYCPRLQPFTYGFHCQFSILNAS